MTLGEWVLAFQNLWIIGLLVKIKLNTDKD